MVTARFQGVVRRLRQTALCESSLSDGELLERYLAQRDETAFAALVRRHGPMVLGVCRRVLADAHDADDAFQATFLVLVKKAGVILPRERVGPWLYGVAYRTSLKAKTMNSRRRAKQKTLEDVPSPDVPCPAASADADWLALLDQEVSRLPDKYRLPIVLCDLEGKTRKQAARQLGWPEGTVSTRLQHGRALVHKRLTRRGLTLSASALTLAWAQAVSAAAVPGPLVASTIQTASAFAAGKAAGIVPLKIAALTQGVLHAMVLNKVKNVSALLLMVGVLGFSLAGLSGGLRTAAAQAPPPTRDPSATQAGAPVAETVQRTPMEINQGRLPTGPAPVQALVSLDKDKVVVKTNQPFYQPRTMIDGLGRQITYYEAVFALQAVRYERSAVEVYDTSRRKLDNKDMAKWLKEEIPALVLRKGTDIDPLHLRLIKEGTLIFMLPPLTPTATGTVPGTAPGVPQAVVPVAPVPEYSPPPPPVETLPPQPPLSSHIEQAERELAMAEFYLKVGQRGSAAFYYEMIGRRYPGTSYAQRAAQLLKELPRQEKAPAKSSQPPVRVGEIIIRGDRRVPDAVILENVPIYPGQVLNYNDLRVAEDNLGRLDAFVNASPIVKLRPTVTVVESRRDAQFKDILVTVQESLRLDVLAEMKKLQGTWSVVSIAHDKMEKATPNGPEIVISGDQFITKSKQSAGRTSYVLDLSTTPKGIRLTPLEGAFGTQPSSGSYEIDGDTLKLMLRSGSSSTEMIMILKRKSGATSQAEPVRDSGDKTPETASDRSLRTSPVTSQVKLDFPATGLNIVAAEIVFLDDNRVKLSDATLTWQKGPRNVASQRIQARRIVLSMDGPIHQVADLGTRQIVSMDIWDAISIQQRD